MKFTQGNIVLSEKIMFYPHTPAFKAQSGTDVTISECLYPLEPIGAKRPKKDSHPTRKRSFERVIYVGISLERFEWGSV